MKTDEFRAWLEHRRITTKSVNTRIHALTKTNAGWNTLAQSSVVYDADGLRALLERLSTLRTDAKGGQPVPRLNAGHDYTSPGLVRLSLNSRAQGYGDWLVERQRKERQSAVPRDGWESPLGHIMSSPGLSWS